MRELDPILPRLTFFPLPHPFGLHAQARLVGEVKQRL